MVAFGGEQHAPPHVRRSHRARGDPAPVGVAAVLDRPVVGHPGRRAERPRNDSLAGALTRAFGESRFTTVAAVVLGLGVLALGVVSFRAAVRCRAPMSAVLVLGSTMGLMSPITWTHHLVFLSLLLWFPLLSWRERPGASALALVIAIRCWSIRSGPATATHRSVRCFAPGDARDPGVPRTAARPRATSRSQTL